MTQTITALRLQRLLYALLCVIFALSYLQLHNPWYLLLPLMATIDLTFFSFLAGPKIGAWAYNTSHTFIIPFSLLVIWTLTGGWWWQFIGHIWATSIALARSWGFGLKYTKGYGYTQLGKLYKWQIPHPKSILAHIPKKEQQLVHSVLVIEMVLFGVLLILFVL